MEIEHQNNRHKIKVIQKQRSQTMENRKQRFEDKQTNNYKLRKQQLHDELEDIKYNDKEDKKIKKMIKQEFLVNSRIKREDQQMKINKIKKQDLASKIKALEKITDTDNHFMVKYEEEEMEILKRMHRSTSMLTSMNSFFQNLSANKGKKQFLHNPYRSLDPSTKVSLKKNGNKKKNIRFES